jgi:hypothetical protein
MTLRIRNLIILAILFKLILVSLFGLMFAIKPHYPGQIGNKPNSYLFAFYTQDGNNYQDICTNGYQRKYITEPKETIKYLAFLPGLSIALCTLQWFPGSIDMVWYGGVVINFLLWILFVVSIKYFLDKYYKDNAQKLYIISFFVLFPTSFFLQLNYTETIFIPLSFFIWRMVDENKIRQSSILGFLLGFVRITAIPFAVLMWLKYTIKLIKNKKEKTLEQVFFTYKYLLDSLSFLLYGFGSVLTFAYYKYEFGDWGLFFKSQKDFYGRSTNVQSFILSLKDIFAFFNPNWVEISYWDTYDFTRELQNTGFYFYDQTFRQINLYTLPFVFAILASLLLIKKKRYFELFYCWVIWLVPILSSSNSINRYIIQSFPFIIVTAEVVYSNKYLRFPVLIFIAFFYLLYAILHAYGFWIA